MQSDIDKLAEHLVRNEVHLCLSSLVSTLAGAAFSVASGNDLYGLCEQATDLCTPIDDWEEAAIQAGWTGPHTDQFGATYFRDTTDKQTWTCADPVDHGTVALADHTPLLFRREADFEHIIDRLKLGRRRAFMRPQCTGGYEHTLVGAGRAGKHDELPRPGIVLRPQFDDIWRELCEAFDIDPYQWEIYEHWAVSEWLGHDLEELGEKVDFDFAGLVIWARTTSGQSIAADSVMLKVAKLVQDRAAGIVTPATATRREAEFAAFMSR